MVGEMREWVLTARHGWQVQLLFGDGRMIKQVDEGKYSVVGQEGERSRSRRSL